MKRRFGTICWKLQNVKKEALGVCVAADLHMSRQAIYDYNPLGTTSPRKDGSGAKNKTIPRNDGEPFNSG